MKLFFKEYEQKVVNNNGKIEIFKRMKKEENGKGIEVIERNGKKKTRKYRVKKQKNRKNNKGSGIERGNILQPHPFLMAGPRLIIISKGVKPLKTRRRNNAKGLKSKKRRKNKKKSKKNKKRKQKSFLDNLLGV